MKINYTTRPLDTPLGKVQALLGKYGFKKGSCGRLWYNGKGEILAVEQYPCEFRIKRISTEGYWHRVFLDHDTEFSFLLNYNILESSLKDLL